MSDQEKREMNPYPETTDTGLVSYLSFLGINPTDIQCVRRPDSTRQIVFTFVANRKFIDARCDFYAETECNLSAHALIKKYRELTNMVRQMKKDTTNDRQSKVV